MRPGTAFFLATILFSLAAMSFTAAWAGDYAHYWSRRFGDVDAQAGFGAAIDSAGNVIVTGYMAGSAHFGGQTFTSVGSSDIFLAKFDANGNHLWSRCFGDSGSQYGASIAVDGSGDMILWGGFQGIVDFGSGPLVCSGQCDIFLAKFDASGKSLWSRSFSDETHLDIRSLAIDASRNIIIAGSFSSAVNFGGGRISSAGYDDIYVAKLNPNGNHIWSRRFGDAGSQIANSVAVDGSGNLIVTGDFTGTVDFGGGPLTSMGSHDIFLAGLTSAGNHLWSKRFGDERFQSGQCAIFDLSGNVIVTGCFEGAADFGGGPRVCEQFYDIFVSKFDAAGNHLWSRNYGDWNFQYGWSIAAEKSGNIIVTGGFCGVLDLGGGPLKSNGGSTDIFVAILDPNGDCLSSQSFGGASEDFGLCAVNASNSLVLTGYFGGTVDFGGGTLTSAGECDAFLVKFKPSPLMAPRGLAGEPVYGNQSLLGLLLTWNRYVEPMIFQYNLYKSSNENFMPGPGNLLTSQQDTFFYDFAWRWMPHAYYKLIAVDYAGNESPYSSLSWENVYSGTDMPEGPSVAVLEQNHPNPFNPSTMIAYRLPRKCRVALEVYDISGRRTAVLIDKEQDRGSYEAVWNGKDAKGNSVASGLYFCRLTAGNQTISRKMVLLK